MQLLVPSKEGLTSRNRVAVIPFSTMMEAQSSPATAVYHAPQFSVVPVAIVALEAGSTISVAYPVLDEGTVVEPTPIQSH